VQFETIITSRCCRLVSDQLPIPRRQHFSLVVRSRPLVTLPQTSNGGI